MVNLAQHIRTSLARPSAIRRPDPDRRAPSGWYILPFVILGLLIWLGLGWWAVRAIWS